MAATENRRDGNIIYFVQPLWHEKHENFASSSCCGCFVNNYYTVVVAIHSYGLFLASILSE